MLRGINVSGQKIIKMKELKELYESLGFEGVQTYIQSGNVIFRCPQSNTIQLQNRIERKLKTSYGYSVVVLIRTINEFRHLLENHPCRRRIIYSYRMASMGSLTAAL
jgi:uncharacterized protein (DUF1697 family)